MNHINNKEYINGISEQDEMLKTLYNIFKRNVDNGIIDMIYISKYEKDMLVKIKNYLTSNGFV